MTTVEEDDVAASPIEPAYCLIVGPEVPLPAHPSRGELFDVYFDGEDGGVVIGGHLESDLLKTKRFILATPFAQLEYLGDGSWRLM